MSNSYIFKRVAYGLILMLFVVVLNFLLIRLAPGDPAVVIAGEMGGATEEMLEQIREEYGLNKPVLRSWPSILAMSPRAIWAKASFSTNLWPN